MKFLVVTDLEKWILENIYYDHEYGIFLNIKSNNILTNVDALGYQRIHIRNKKINKHIKLHRIAWFLYHGKWPEKCIDHINGNRSDNRIENLRDISRSENSLNKEHHRNGGIPLMCKNPYKKKKGGCRFVVQFPSTLKTNSGHRSVFAYSCEYQAQMAACMILNNEFDKEIHTEKIVNHLNSHGKLLKRNLSFFRDKYIVRKNRKEIFSSTSYDTALNKWRSIYG